ncbi:hypothetical protein BDN71DRAFT_869363 [Pleurotus eryngii]|uniref:Uncharacterized protein n=1 Tax=Pleurotus eryngii TaxID=5323 RepID=A0A9P6D8S2_PLEER|nr:hypothetical protein BDN71DRAFT_869363 [Pleurotus eryngii]
MTSSASHTRLYPCYAVAPCPGMNTTSLILVQMFVLPISLGYCLPHPTSVTGCQLSTEIF